ncbi:MAG: cold-shock protein [Micrococcales bacterium]|nr:cold-shock protein [Micrococcales bacterium]
MQATVHRFDDETHAGSVLLDDGTEVHFDADAFEGSGLRLLRVGQRLTIEADGHEVRSMRIVGIGHDEAIR